MPVESELISGSSCSRFQGQNNRMKFNRHKCTAPSVGSENQLHSHRMRKSHCHSERESRARPVRGRGMMSLCIINDESWALCRSVSLPP